MPMYGKMLKLAELSHFWADFGPLQEIVLALIFELLDQTMQDFQFSKQKNLMTSSEKDDSMQHH